MVVFLLYLKFIEKYSPLQKCNLYLAESTLIPAISAILSAWSPVELVRILVKKVSLILLGCVIVTLYPSFTLSIPITSEL